MKPFTKIAAFLFFIGFVFHATRLFFGWPINIGGHSIPWGVSIFGVVFAGVMSLGLWRESR